MNIEKNVSEVTFGGVCEFQSPEKQRPQQEEDAEMADGILGCSPIVQKHAYYASPMIQGSYQNNKLAKASCQLFSPIPQYKRNYTPNDEKLAADSQIKSQFYGSSASPDFQLRDKTTVGGSSEFTSEHTVYKKQLFSSPNFAEQEILPFDAGDLLDSDSEMRVSDEDDEVYLRVRQIPQEPERTEQASEFVPMQYQRPAAPTEHDRFIPQRPQGQDFASNFEAKEHLFDAKLFDCKHVAGEHCDCNIG